MRLVIFALVLLCACKKERAAEGSAPKVKPPAAPPAVPSDELNQFLNGMLITTDVPPVYGRLWPIQEIDTMGKWVIDGMGKNWGFKDLAELRAFIDVPLSRQTRSHAWAFGNLDDKVRQQAVYLKLVKEDPTDLEAVLRASEYLYDQGDFEGALAVMANTRLGSVHNIDERTEQYAPAKMEGSRCNLLVRLKRLDEAAESCAAAAAVDDRYGAHTLARIRLAQGKPKEALAQMELVAKLPGRTPTTAMTLTLGLAHQMNGDDAKAAAIWKAWLAQYNDPLIARIAGGEKHTMLEWIEEEQKPNQTKRDYAYWAAICGHNYADMGWEERSRDCYAQSLALMPDFARAQKLVHVGETDVKKGIAEAKAVVKEDSRIIDELTAMAWLHLKNEDLVESRKWLERALKLSPVDLKGRSLMWQLCGKEKDYLCAIDYRKGLGLPTHFNVAEYNILENAWKEQAWKNGADLAPPDPDSEKAPKPPETKTITLVPMGTRVPAELEGLVDALKGKFAGVDLRLGVVEPIPAGAFKEDLKAVQWEALSRKLTGAGRIFVLEEDLVTGKEAFAFSRSDLEHGRIVLSLSRLRSLVGKPTPSNQWIDSSLREGAKSRLLGEVAGSIGALLGMSSPCPVSSCAMRERRSVVDFATNGFCERHENELKQILAARKVSGLALLRPYVEARDGGM